jgi:hypothetical protein
VPGDRSTTSHRVYVSTEEETQLRAVAAAHGDITIPRLLIESALAPPDSTPMYNRRELLAELFALRRLRAGRQPT